MNEGSETELSMVERVARQLEPQAWAALGIGDTLAYSNRRTSSLRKAHKAIDVMRKPSPAQERVMLDLLERDDRPPTKRWHWVWDEMIEAALKEHSVTE